MDADKREAADARVCGASGALERWLFKVNREREKERERERERERETGVEFWKIGWNCVSVEKV